MLQETTDEMARNGCKKIVIVNGHGGNESLLPLFAQSQLAKEHDYVVYVFGLPHLAIAGRPPLQDSNDMHAGESETSHMMANRPELVHQDRAPQESGADQNRQHLPQSIYTGIWWYAKLKTGRVCRSSSMRMRSIRWKRNSRSGQILRTRR